MSKTSERIGVVATIILIGCIIYGGLHLRDYVDIKDVKWQIIETRQIEMEIPPIIEKPLTTVDVIKKVKPGVVHLQCPSWQGSAFVVGPQLLVTARHCVKGVTNFEITTDGGHKLHATRAISSKKYDVAFIYIDDLTCIAENCSKWDCQAMSVLQGKHTVCLKVLELGSIVKCQLGQEIITIGSSYGKVNFNSVTLGIISGLNRDYDELNNNWYEKQDYGWSVAFQTDSPGHPGNSGCPIFTTDGIVRGLLVGGLSPSLVICMPVDLFIDDIEKVKLMFIMDKYKFEEELEYSDFSYNYE